MSLLAMRADSALAIFLMLNAVTPFITPDPPWLANLPLVAIMAFLLAFGLSHIRAEGARNALRTGDHTLPSSVPSRQSSIHVATRPSIP